MVTRNERPPAVTTLRCSLCGGPCALEVGCLTHAAAKELRDVASALVAEFFAGGRTMKGINPQHCLTLAWKLDDVLAKAEGRDRPAGKIAGQDDGADLVEEMLRGLRVAADWLSDKGIQANHVEMKRILAAIEKGETFMVARAGRRG